MPPAFSPLARLAFRASATALGAKALHQRAQEGYPLRCELAQPPAKAVASTYNFDWDRRHPYEGGDVALQGPTRWIILIRHGQYENRGGPEYGKLTNVGREQATMAGQHVVARMREDPSFKGAMYHIKSSGMDRAIETADLIEKEIVDELEWVDVKIDRLPNSMKLRFVRDMGEGFAEFSVVHLEKTMDLVCEGNLLQPQVQLSLDSRLRVRFIVGQSDDLVGIVSPETLHKLQHARLAVQQPLAPIFRPPAHLRDLECSSCGKDIDAGDIHWSDDVAENKLGFCDDCFAKGPKHKKMREEDTMSGVTKAIPCSAIRMPNDKNLNEACPEPLQDFGPDDGMMFTYFGSWNGITNSEVAQANAGFCANFHRAVDHKTIKRSDRRDVLKIVFEKLAPGTEKEVEADELRHWTAQEFKRLPFTSTNLCSKIFCEDAKKDVGGLHRVRSIEDEDVSACSSEDLVNKVEELHAKKCKTCVTGKQVELYVVHGNIIRWTFMRLMQFDSSRWLDLGGSNCTMTQFRIRSSGLVTCDFFAAHESKMPASHYTYNASKDV